MTSSAFAYESAVAACDECGAPRPLGAAGGEGACNYCGNDAPAAAGSRAVPRAEPQLDEATRLAHLARQQAAAPVPAELAPLFVGPELLPWKVSEALALWNEARAALRAGPRPEVELRLHHLTAGLAAHFARAGDALRERSLLEGALAVLRDAGYRQAACAALARGACRAGDAAAARRWLEACDPEPHGLEADTAFRFAAAYLATFEGRADRVLEVLAEGVPVAALHEPACTALRAHAWERSGRPDVAVAVLEAYFARAGAYGRCLFARFLAQHPAGGLCAASAPAAFERARQRGIHLAGRRAGAPKLLLGIAMASWLVLALATVVAFLFGGFGWALYLFGIVGLVPMVFAVLAVGDLRSHGRLRRLLEQGTAALARVLDVRSTKTSTRGVPELRYRVLVQPPAAEPFEGYAVFHADPADRARCAPGSLVVVRSLAGDATNLAIEVD